MVKVQVVIGRCPTCGARTESADVTGLKGLKCGRDHSPVEYVPADAYYQDAAETWRD